MARPNHSNKSDILHEPDRPITPIALYARVGTLNNQDPEMQLVELREYAGHRDLQIVEEYTDHGVLPSTQQQLVNERMARFAQMSTGKSLALGRDKKVGAGNDRINPGTN